ncbi:MAG: serine hydroxymethyltransferase, partial [Gammaproteobacteria bacterium]
ALGAANITVNKNTVPSDPQSPFVTSGLRIGTPAMTTRGLGVTEVRQVAHWICDIIDNIENIDVQTSIKAEVLAMCSRFPVYR